MQNESNAIISASPEVATESTASAKPARRVSSAKKTGKTSSAKKVTKAAEAPKAEAAASDGKIVLKSLCSQLKINPRIARRKLRKAGLAFHGHRDRWTFTEKQAEKVKEVLRPN
jgi:hypothetical protein